MTKCKTQLSLTLLHDKCETKLSLSLLYESMNADDL